MKSFNLLVFCAGIVSKTEQCLWIPNEIATRDTWHSIQFVSDRLVFSRRTWENGRVQNSQHDLLYSVDPEGAVRIKDA